VTLAVALGVGVALSLGQSPLLARAATDTEHSAATAAADSDSTDPGSDPGGESGVGTGASADPGGHPAGAESPAEAENDPDGAEESSDVPTPAEIADELTEGVDDALIGDIPPATGIIVVTPLDPRDTDEAEPEPVEPAPVKGLDPGGEPPATPEPVAEPPATPDPTAEPTPTPEPTVEPPAPTGVPAPAPTWRDVVPESAAKVALWLPRLFVEAVASVVSMVLTPFLGPLPPPPADPPLLWAVLAWVRREINRAFFNAPPRVENREITLVLQPGQVDSGPIPLGAFDADGDRITYSVPERGQPGGPQHGTVTINPDGTFTYTPDPGFTGTDRFTVRVSDAGAAPHAHGLLSLFVPGPAHADEATITLHVTATPEPPAAGDGAFSTSENQSVTLDLSTLVVNPADDMVFEILDPPTLGRLGHLGGGLYRYTPDEHHYGLDTFTYTVSIDGYTSKPAIVRIDIAPITDRPVAVPDHYEFVFPLSAISGHAHLGEVKENDRNVGPSTKLNP